MLQLLARHRHRAQIEFGLASRTAPMKPTGGKNRPNSPDRYLPLRTQTMPGRRRRGLPTAVNEPIISRMMPGSQ